MFNEKSWSLILLDFKLGQGYVFTHVCDSVHRGGSASVHAGIPTHPPAPPGKETLPPTGRPLCAVHAGRYGQQAGGMHPTGMQFLF